MATIYENQQNIASQSSAIILEALKLQDGLQKLVENINKFEGNKDQLLNMLPPLVTNGIKQSVFSSVSQSVFPSVSQSVFPSASPSVSPLVSSLVSPLVSSLVSPLVSSLVSPSVSPSVFSSLSLSLSSSPPAPLPTQLFSRENSLYKTVFNYENNCEMYYKYFNKYATYNEERVYFPYGGLEPTKKWHDDICDLVYCLRQARQINFHDDGKLMETRRGLFDTLDEWVNENSAHQTLDQLHTICIENSTFDDNLTPFDEKDQAVLKQTCNSSIAVVLYCAYICWYEIKITQKYHNFRVRLPYLMNCSKMMYLDDLFVRLCRLVKHLSI